MESKFQAGVGYFMSRAGKGGCLHVLSYYAPTFAAGREEMAKFFSTVQQALTFIPSQRAMCYMGVLMLVLAQVWRMMNGGMKRACMVLDISMMQVENLFSFSVVNARLLHAILGL